MNHLIYSGIEFEGDNGPVMLKTWDGVPWLFYKHPGGQWVSLRKATSDDIEAVLNIAGLKSRKV